MICEHGGNIGRHDILYDFSANLNPLGMPESVKKAAAAAVEYSDKYPDPYCRGLVKKLAEHESFPEKKIVCGNGADDLIYRTIHALRPAKAVITAPTFSEYAKALTEVDCKITEYGLDERNGFALDEGILSELKSGTDMLILCNPNNPTGRLINRELLDRICKKCGENGIFFLCDECFTDLAEGGNEHSARSCINGNIAVLKAFTKTFAMAGLRLGYALFGSPKLAERVRSSGQFWSVSAPAQAAGIAALDETGYINPARKIISTERKFLSEKLRNFGFTVYPSDANFILFRCGIPLDEMLLNEKILIRNCANFDSLGEGYFRIAVRTHEENEALCSAAERVIKWQKR